MTRKRAVVNNKKDSMISFKITQDQYDRIAKIGKAYGIGPHEWCRMMIVEEIPKKEVKIANKEF